MTVRKAEDQVLPRPKGPDSRVTDPGSGRKLWSRSQHLLGLSLLLCKVGIMKATEPLVQWLGG